MVYCYRQNTDKRKGTMHSYKPVFLLSFLKNMNETGSAKLEDVAKDFAAYYVSAKSKYEPPGGAHDHRTKTA